MSDEGAIDTPLEQVGEKGFLAHLLPTLTPHSNFVNGFGDDASIVRWPGSENLVFKIDRAAAPMASRRGWAGYEMWGRLAVTSNCSDILAGGGTPLAVMIALVLPRDWSTRATIDIIRGCADECSINDITFAGGDTKEGKSPELVGAAVGYCDANGYLTRKGAAPGDLIVIAGSVGGFLGSYLQFLNSLRGGLDERADSLAPWLEYMTHPQARWSEGAFVNKRKLAKAAMDTSDGLFDALSVLTEGLGAEIDLEELPHHREALMCSKTLGIPLINLALGVGDWNIVYVMDKGRLTSQALRMAKEQGLRLTAIGRVTQEPGLKWIDREGNPYRCRAVVNQHFSARFEDDESTLIERLKSETHLIPWSAV